MFYGGAVFGGERNFAVVTVRDVSNIEGKELIGSSPGPEGGPFQCTLIWGSMIVELSTVSAVAT